MIIGPRVLSDCGLRLPEILKLTQLSATQTSISNLVGVFRVAG